MAKDTIKIRVLADGTIKAETDAVSEANHLAADELLAWLQGKAGGTFTLEQKASTRQPNVVQAQSQQQEQR